MPPKLWPGDAGAGVALHPPVAVLADQGLASGDLSAKCSCDCLAWKDGSWGAWLQALGGGGEENELRKVVSGRAFGQHTSFSFRCAASWRTPRTTAAPSACLPLTAGCSYRPHPAPRCGTPRCSTSVLAGSLGLPLARGALRAERGGERRDAPPEPVTHAQPLPSHPRHVPPPRDAR